MKFPFVVCVTLILCWNLCEANSLIDKAASGVFDRAKNGFGDFKDKVQNKLGDTVESAGNAVSGAVGDLAQNGLDKFKCATGNCGNNDSPNPPPVNNNEEYKPVEVYHPQSFEIPQPRNRYQSSSSSNEKSEEVQPEPKSNNVVPSAEPENTGSQQQISLTLITVLICTWIFNVTL